MDEPLDFSKLDWKRLDRESKRILGILAVVPGGSVDAGAIATGWWKAWTLKKLDALIRTGFVEAVEGRYRLVEGGRNPISVWLGKDEAVVRKALRQHYLDYVRKCKVKGDEVFRQGFEADGDNFWEVMGWAWEAQDWYQVIDFAEAILPYFQSRKPAALIRERAEWRLEAARRAENSYEEARALVYLGDLQEAAGAYPAAMECYAGAELLYRGIGQHLLTANAIGVQGRMAFHLGDEEIAKKRFTEALAIYRDLGNLLGEANVHGSFGEIFFSHNSWGEAVKEFETALEFYRVIGERRGMLNILLRLGAVFWGLSDYQKVKEYYQTALEICRELGDLNSEAEGLRALGDVQRYLAEYEPARDNLEKARQIFQKLKDPEGEVRTLRTWEDLEKSCRGGTPKDENSAEVDSGK